jgi:hypothetical protein
MYQLDIITGWKEMMFFCLLLNQIKILFLHAQTKLWLYVSEIHLEANKCLEKLNYNNL